MAFKMAGYSYPGKSSMKKVDDEKETANFMSFAELESSDVWKSAKPGDKYTHWATTSACPDCPKEKVIQTVTKRK